MAEVDVECSVSGEIEIDGISSFGGGVNDGRMGEGLDLVRTGEGGYMKAESVGVPALVTEVQMS